MTPPALDGWAIPDNERKSHFFVGGVSLCDYRWRYKGATTPEPRPHGHTCRICHERASGR